MYNARDHYWIRKDGSLYSSARQCDCAPNDANYAAWCKSGGVATRYPLDSEGNESAAELAAVLAVYGLSMYPATVLDVQTAKRQQINSGFDAAMTASLTMPSSSTPPLAFEVAYAIYDWRTEDPDGYAALLAIHTARRDQLLAAVDAAPTVEAVQAIAVSYAV